MVEIKSSELPLGGFAPTAALVTAFHRMIKRMKLSKALQRQRALCDGSYLDVTTSYTNAGQGALATDFMASLPLANFGLMCLLAPNSDTSKAFECEGGWTTFDSFRTC
jgi:hypothetical protein